MNKWYKAIKEHHINGAFWNSESVKPSSLKMIHCFKELQLERVSRIIWNPPPPRENNTLVQIEIYVFAILDFLDQINAALVSNNKKIIRKSYWP